MVSKVVEAVCRDGALHPVEPLPLDEHDTVWVGILENEGVVPLHSHIAQSPEVCGGRPHIRATRILVQTLYSTCKHGLNVDEILVELPT